MPFKTLCRQAVTLYLMSSLLSGLNVNLMKKLLLTRQLSVVPLVGLSEDEHQYSFWDDSHVQKIRVENHSF